MGVLSALYYRNRFKFCKKITRGCYVSRSPHRPIGPDCNYWYLGSIPERVKNNPSDISSFSLQVFRLFYKRSVEEDGQLSFHLFGLLAAGLPSRAIFFGHSALALSTCWFQYRRRSFVHFTISWISHSSLISLVLILSHSVNPSIDLSVFISVDLRSCSVLGVSALAL